LILLWILLSRSPTPHTKHQECLPNYGILLTICGTDRMSISWISR
jgi:hypothetical protein